MNNFLLITRTPKIYLYNSISPPPVPNVKTNKQRLYPAEQFTRGVKCLQPYLQIVPPASSTSSQSVLSRAITAAGQM